MPGNPYEGRQYGYCGGGYGYCGTPAAGAALLLDNLAATYGAWSVARQIRTAYSGALIRVREDSGNTEADIPVANGVLDESALSSHVGANNGYITKIYNQDANGSTLDFAQATTTIQPIIVESGTIVKENGKPAAKFVAADSRRMVVPTSVSLFDFLHDGTKSSISSVFKANNTAAAKVILATHVSSSARGVSIYLDTSERLTIVVAGDAAARSIVSIKNEALSIQEVLSVLLDASNATSADRETSYANNTLLIGANTETSSPASGDSSGDMTLGTRSAAAFPFDGTMQELILWPTDESASRTTWEADMADFYGVTLA